MLKNRAAITRKRYSGSTYIHQWQPQVLANYKI